MDRRSGQVLRQFLDFYAIRADGWQRRRQPSRDGLPVDSVIRPSPGRRQLKSAPGSYKRAKVAGQDHGAAGLRQWILGERSDVSTDSQRTAECSVERQLHSTIRGSDWRQPVYFRSWSEHTLNRHGGDERGGQIINLPGISELQQRPG